MTIIAFPTRHARAPAASFRASKASMRMPVASLNRLASGKDAVLRPSRRLRKCDGEQPTSLANLATAFSSGIKASSGCVFDMTITISTRNSLSQGEIFPVEMSMLTAVRIPSDMAKARQKRTFCLGEWLDALAGGMAFKRGYVTQMAELIGVSQGQMSSMIGGRKVPENHETLLDLSELVGVTVNDLFKVPPPETQMARIRPYSKFYEQFVDEKLKKSPAPAVSRPRRHA